MPPLVPKVVSELFGEHNYNVVRNPKTHVQIDDARHFLLTTHEKFDAITSVPFDPWVKGAASLYSREFWEEAKRHLNPGGLLALEHGYDQAERVRALLAAAGFTDFFSREDLAGIARVSGGMWTQS